MNQTKARQGVGLLISLIIIGAVGYGLWLVWPKILLFAIVEQKQLVSLLTQELRQLQGSAGIGWGLIGASFIYGVVHAIGPGHGKMVVSTYLATHPTRVKSSLVITITAALMQALVAITLVTLILFVFQLSIKTINSQLFTLIRISYLLVLLLGIGLIVQNLRKLLRSKSHSSHHHHGCSCGHQHVPNDRALSDAVTLRTKLGLILSFGIRPCSGAILILFFSSLMKVYSYGVICALVMALGTALTISTLALCTLFGRRSVVTLLKRCYLRKGEPTHNKGRARAMTGMTGGVLLILLSLLLFQSEPKVIGPAIFTTPVVKEGAPETSSRKNPFLAAPTPQQQNWIADTTE
ncbi:nickel/cobalt transporter [Dongshaea marina]|uniref:nickel/cobalt transporter n=1 Tax=Dongshaea marina TaxID=2047966 RepID=UPI000D3E4810|nr:nickel/cobalt transporter [Dongshaea marina]